MNEERVALERASEAVRVRADALNAAHRDLATRAIAPESPLTNDGAPPEQPAPPAFVARKGGRVYVTRLGRNAEVIDVLDGGSVRVLAGKLKVVVPMHELRGADD
jgi:DNA mismatch repair protein MutS2